jgi:hypothetical protein
MTRTVLLTLGRLPKALDLARGFAAAGWRVIVAEPFNWHLTRVSRAVHRSYQVTAPSVNARAYQLDLLRIVHIEQVELIVPVSEEILHVAALHGQLPDGVRLHAPQQLQLLALHDKRRFIELCGHYGVSAPETALLGESAATALAAAHDHVIKPVFSCSGRGLQLRTQGQPLPSADPLQPQVVQRQLKGPLLSTFTLAHSGRARLTVVYRAAVLSGSVAVCFERVTEADPVHAKVLDWVQRFVAAADCSGFISFDLIDDAQAGISGIECNPRATSGLHFVDAVQLARAVVDPAAADPSLKPLLHMQQFYPCLTEVQRALLARDGSFARGLRYLRSARDVTWDWRDPLPFLTQPLTASQIIVLAIRHGATFGEVSMLDLGWYPAALL